ncbi:MAG: sugar transferase [Thermodesulfobacteriota bacterium]
MLNSAETRGNLKRAVILAGEENVLLTPLVKHMSILNLPVFNRPIIEHTMQCLAHNGITSVIIVGRKGGGVEIPAETFGDKGPPLKIEYFEPDVPCGTAGVLRELQFFLGDEDFLVLQGNTFVEYSAVEELVRFHLSRGSALTIGVSRLNSGSLETLTAGKDGLVEDITIIHASRDRRAAVKSEGIYVVNTRALSLVEGEGYFDIKEQLVPAMKKAALPVYMHRLDGLIRTIESVDDYYNFHRSRILEGHVPSGFKEVGANVWVGRDVAISPRSYLLGPAVIGDNCVVRDHAQVIGPVILGSDCFIDEGAIVRESILWKSTEVRGGASLFYCVAASNTDIKAGQSYNNKTLVGDITHGDANIVTSRDRTESVSGVTMARMEAVRSRAYLMTKRVMDLLLSTTALLLLSPLMLAIAIIIKLDSPGAILYRQKRCGKGGREFCMFKFRTMIKDAHKLQKKYMESKNVDGPVFKLDEDPRITRIGGFLRKTSLDELPQLMNVIRGDMSLVGPRPLVMGEMKFSQSWRDIRLKVKPGVTGLWQVEGRNTPYFHDWIRYDVAYVKEQSLTGDLKIILKTIKVVLKKIGAR